MSYKGTLKEGGATFDQAKKFKFCLGAGEVIKGWEVIYICKVGGSLSWDPRVGGLPDYLDINPTKSMICLKPHYTSAGGSSRNEGGRTKKADCAS